MIHIGDCRDILPTLPAESVQCCVTSPPYFGLRDYGVDGQMGLEPTPDEFIDGMVAVFREVRRILKPDGTLWLNIGDSYAQGHGGSSTMGGGVNLRKAARGAHESKAREGIDVAGWSNRDKSIRNIVPGTKPKDLMGIPWMFAFALRADGAASPAHMRDIERIIAAVTDSYDSRAEWPDRLAAEVERLEREHIDANRGGWYLRQDIIWAKPNPMPESVTDRCTKAHEYLFLLSKSPRYYFDAEAISEEANLTGKGNANGFRGGAYCGGSAFENGGQGGKRTQSGNSSRYSFARETKQSAGEHGQKPQHRPDREDVEYSGRRNKRSVWTVATQPFREAHFATFPPALIQPCILAGSRPGDVVLDPFLGAGTTALVCEQLGRQWVGCELNPEYAEIARRRIAAVQPGLALGTAA